MALSNLWQTLQPGALTQISVLRFFSALYLRGGGGGSPGEKGESIRSQLRALATRTPSLRRCGQGAWL